MSERKMFNHIIFRLVEFEKCTGKPPIKIKIDRDKYEQLESEVTDMVLVASDSRKKVFRGIDLEVVG